MFFFPLFTSPPFFFRKKRFSYLRFFVAERFHRNNNASNFIDMNGVYGGDILIKESTFFFGVSICSLLIVILGKELIPFQGRLLRSRFIFIVDLYGCIGVIFPSFSLIFREVFYRKQSCTASVLSGHKISVFLVSSLFIFIIY